jgi:hypothetical protein
LFCAKQTKKKDRFADEFKKVLAPDLKKRNDVIITEKNDAELLKPNI